MCGRGCMHDALKVMFGITCKDHALLSSGMIHCDVTMLAILDEDRYSLGWGTELLE